MVKRFLGSRRTGFYLAVAREGMVAAGDDIRLIDREQEEIRVSDITRLYAFEKHDHEGLERAIRVAALPESWKDHFRKQLKAA